MKPSKARRITSERRTPPERGRASSYIDKAKFGPGTRVILVSRVSTGPQDRNNNPQDQEAKLWKIADKRRWKVVGTFDHCGPGANPEWLAEAAAHARSRKAVLFGESTDRFIRPRGFSPSKAPNEQATGADLKRLLQVSGNVPLATYLHPDATPKEVQSYQKRRGQQQKGRKGGRPRKQKAGHKKQERLRRMSDVLELLWLGCSRRVIANLLDLHLTQVQRFVARFRNGELCTHFLCKTKWFNEEFPKE